MTGFNGITYYSDVKSSPVDWLWYPYIPYGKITILQGDPGDGKSTLMMQIIAAASNGENVIAGMNFKEPEKVIYQCSEDGASDTIKPRLERAGANCSNVCFIQENDNMLTLEDERIVMSLAFTKARLLIIDPLQAYVGDDGNLFVTTKARKLMQRLSMWATAYSCAIVLAGHLNKKEGSKSLYRSIGSIDVVASARSVLQLERCSTNQEVRRLHQVKCSLATRGEDLYFVIDETGRLNWVDAEDGDHNEEEMEVEENSIPSKQEQICELLTELLKDGPVHSTIIMEKCISCGFSERTIKKIKKIIGIESYRQDGQWFWQLCRKEE